MAYPIRLVPDGDTAWGADIRAVIAGVNDHQTRVTALESSTTSVINVKDYGALGNGSTNDTDALDAALAAARSSGTPLYVPHGIYKRTTPWDCRFNGLTLYGDGPDKSIILQATVNTEGIQLGHSQQYVHDIGVTYQSTATSAHTNSNAFAFYKSDWSTYERLSANYAARSFYIPQVNYNLNDGFDDGTNNWSFSCTFTDIVCNKYAIGAFRMDSYIGASTGNTYRNIYTHQGNNPCTGAVVSWTNQTEMICDQINLEHVVCNAAPVISLTACLSAVFHSVHVEGVTMSGFDTPIFRLYDRVHLDVQSMTIQYNTISSTGGGTKAIFQPGEGCFVHATSVQIGGNTVTGTWTGVHLDSASTSGDVYMINIDTSELSSTYQCDTVSIPRIRQFNRTLAGVGGAVGASAQLYATYSGGTILTVTAQQTTNVVLSGTAYNAGLDVTTHANEITIPVGGAGRYLPNVMMHYKTGTAGGRSAMLMVNGVRRVEGGGYGSGDVRFALGFPPVTLADGDRVTLSTYNQNDVTIESYDQADTSLALTRIS